MAQPNLSTRQKMINLMYLVFIAMLAMQIDQEIIRSYRDTSDTLENTRSLTEDKNKIFETTLAAKAQENPDGFAVAYQAYQDIRAKANDLVMMIDGIKSEMMKQGGYAANASIEDNFSALNDTNPATTIFFQNGEATSPSQKANDLKAKMNVLKQALVGATSQVPALNKVKDRANQTLQNDKPVSSQAAGQNTWISSKFYNQPLVAALANLEVIQSEARNIQSDALSIMLQDKVDANIKFNSFEAVVSAPSVILQGEVAEGRVFVAPTSTDINANISGVDRTDGVRGFKTLSSSTIGDFSFAGTISFPDASGKMINLPYQHKYKVIAGSETKKEDVKLQSGAIVSADKMNVLYRGVPNPISASMLGVDNKTVSLSAPGASVSGGGGKWTISPGAGSTVNIVVSGRDPNGKPVSATFPFRIKNIPPPQGQVRGSNALAMPASSIANQTVTATIPDFDFPVNFTVTGFKFKAPGRAAAYISGNSLASVAPLVRSLRSGETVYVFDIEATATGIGNQQLKRISPVMINVQ